MPVATAWLKRAESMLEGLPENQGHGWLAATRAFHSALVGDTEDALAQATLAHEIGQRLELPDLTAFALGAKAAILVARGDVDEGLAMADEATVAAMSGELDPQIAGGVFCTTIEACAGIGDVKRAAEWTEAQDRWCRREGINGFPGMCRLFRSDVKRMRGSLAGGGGGGAAGVHRAAGLHPGGRGAGACTRSARFGCYRGDLPAAEEALLGAHGLGQDTEPANALLLAGPGQDRSLPRRPSGSRWTNRTG